jgi:hypothetical protein
MVVSAYPHPNETASYPYQNHTYPHSHKPIGGQNRAPLQNNHKRERERETKGQPTSMGISAIMEITAVYLSVWVWQNVGLIYGHN